MRAPEAPFRPRSDRSRFKEHQPNTTSSKRRLSLPFIAVGVLGYLDHVIHVASVGGRHCARARESTPGDNNIGRYNDPSRRSSMSGGDLARPVALSEAGIHLRHCPSSLFSVSSKTTSPVTSRRSPCRPEYRPGPVTEQSPPREFRANRISARERKTLFLSGIVAGDPCNYRLPSFFLSRATLPPPLRGLFRAGRPRDPLFQAATYSRNREAYPRRATGY